MLKKSIPVILDTDIGGDIDDAWALALLLQSPEVDLKMVISATGDTEYRAKIIAKMLTVAGRSDIPIGIGMPTEFDGDLETVKEWVSNYDLENYPGEVYSDGIGTMNDMVKCAREPVTILSIAALSNIAEALKRYPELAARCNFVGMHGSLYKDYEGKPGRLVEYNVKVDVKSCQTVFNAHWRNITITPVDTCGLVSLDGEIYQRLYRSHKPLLCAVKEQYGLWHSEVKADWKIEERSSTLFDTVAAFLTFSHKFMSFKTLGITVTDDGFTVPDPAAGNNITAAVEWTDLEAFKSWLCERLLK